MLAAQSTYFRELEARIGSAQTPTLYFSRNLAFIDLSSWTMATDRPAHRPEDAVELSVPPPPPAVIGRSPSLSSDVPRPSPGRRAWTLLKAFLNLLIEQWFILGIGIVILLAHFFPNVGRTGGIIKAVGQPHSVCSPRRLSR